MTKDGIASLCLELMGDQAFISFTAESAENAENKSGKYFLCVLSVLCGEPYTQAILDTKLSVLHEETI